MDGVGRVIHSLGWEREIPRSRVKVYSKKCRCRMFLSLGSPMSVFVINTHGACVCVFVCVCVCVCVCVWWGEGGGGASSKSTLAFGNFMSLSHVFIFRKSNVSSFY